MILNNIYKKLIKNRFYKKIFIFSILIIITINLLTIGIIYYWSFYYYNHIFEDRIIDQETLKYNKELGVENTWLLGVNTHSIDVLEATYNKTISDHIYQQALTQNEVIKYYREKIDGKSLIYCIELRPDNGEYYYRYSVIRDLYHEGFWYIILTIVLFLIFMVIVFYKYVCFIDKQFSKELTELNTYVHKLENLDFDIEPIDLQFNNDILKNLAETFRKMHIRLKEKENIQKSTLQYISHEMKSPIMIIESYTVSAKEQIYPTGSLNNSLDTILSQTDRMKEKVDSLLKYVSISTKELNIENIDLTDVIYNIFMDYSSQIRLHGKFIYHIEENMEIQADREKIRIILQNLLENQLKYRDKLITIRAYKKTPNIELLFYNDGESINNKLRSQIFTPFIKGYNGFNGLGLSITKTILIQHGGNIKLLTTSKGTLFKVTLPISFKENI